jgi:hypothetical protein
MALIGEPEKAGGEWQGADDHGSLDKLKRGSGSTRLIRAGCCLPHQYDMRLNEGWMPRVKFIRRGAAEDIFAPAVAGGQREISAWRSSDGAT